MSLKRFHIICSFCFLITFSFASTKEDLISYDTGYTITKVRTGKSLKRSFIVASSFEGILMRLDYDGSLVWKHSLSGFMNHDIWVGDLDNDGIDEIVVANANGSVYCLDSQGVLKWQLDLGMTPVYSVSAIQVKGKMYVVCGAMDKNMYYITAEGVLAKTIPSENYSIEKTWGKTHQMPPPDSNQHITNFIRKAKFKGKSIVVVHGAVHATAAKGNLYLFEPLSEKPFDIINIKSNTGPIGDLQVIDQDNDGTSEILLGASSMIKGAKATMIHLDHIKNESQINFKKTNGIDGFGYRVVQNLLIDIKGEAKVFSLFGSRIVLSSYDLNEQEVLRSKYSFNDWCFDPYRKRIVLASAQSGGSAIHIINLKAKNWKKAYEEIEPIGKIATLKYNHQKLSKKIALFKKPAWERDPIQVCFMTEGTNNPFVKNKIKKLHSNYSSPIFLNNTWKTQKEIWNRKKLIGENKYNYAVDKRMKYSFKGKEAATQFKYLYLGDSKGASYWGGHGNDPMFYSLSTYDEIFKQAKGKPTVFVFPEVEDMHDDLKVVLDNYIFPLAEKAKKYNSKLYLRNKHVFWLGNVYLPMWKPIFTGQYKDVIIPSMEETTDKSMELSVASRMGIWASGVVNDWGARCARDNSSFDRLRQHSHQMLPNHFFRTQLYNIASGAIYLNNFSVDQQYMSLLWDMIAKGVLFVPKKEEIVSFNPVHLSITNPDKSFLNEGNNVKWLTFFDKNDEIEHPRVFNRLNGTWPGSPTTYWDFSTYAAKEKERRLNFLPKFSKGLVLITPLQSSLGKQSKSLTENLHPLYRNILQEYATNGTDYVDVKTSEKYNAKEYYKTIEKSIEEGSKKIPLTITGDVAWVAAQTASKHIRLTLVDNGYINPSEKNVKINFNTINVYKVKDMLTKESFIVDSNTLFEIKVPCGGFRLLDIELKNNFY